MRLHNTCYAIASLMLLGSAAEARRVNARFFLDGALGPSIPISDSGYAATYWPAPKLSLRLGAELWITRRFGVAPELALEGEPLISRYDDGVHTGKGRALVGVRLLAGFGHGHAFFGRFLIGVEGSGTTATSQAAFSTEPGLGMQFRIARHAVVGFTIGFPIGVYRFRNGNGDNTTVFVDFDLMGFIGLRI